MEAVNKSLDYESLVRNLMRKVPEINAVAIIKGQNEIVYSTENWNICADIQNLCSSWDSMKASFIVVFGIKFTMLQCEIDIMVATSLQEKGHIVGCKDAERRIITYITPEGDTKAAIIEISRILAEMSSKESRADQHIQSDSTHPTTEQRNIPLVNPQLKNEIEQFNKWIKSPKGFQGYINYYLQQNNARIISELARIYNELRKICGV